MTKNSVKNSDSTFVDVYLSCRRRGMKPGDSFLFLQQSGYKKTNRTLLNQIKKLNTTDDEEHARQKVGPKYSLTMEQMDEVQNFILVQNENHVPLQRKDVRKYIHDRFDIMITEQTVGNILARLGLTIKACQTKTSGFKLSNPELKVLFWNFIVAMKGSDTFSIALKEICSIDITHTTRPAGNVTTFSPKGGGKQKNGAKVVLYTNSIVTLIWADGVDRTPCILYTHDPRFNPDRPINTELRIVQKEAYNAAFDKYGISNDRVVYIESTKHYCGESSVLYEHFLDHYKVEKNVLILHDGGNAFKRESTSIFEENGYKNHVTYPAAVHQYLSPNDNKLHGIKAAWKQNYYKMDDSISPSLSLMQLIDLDSKKNSYTYFQNNLLDVTKGDLDYIIGG
jgi:transposase